MVNIVKSELDPAPLADFKADKAAMVLISDCHYEGFLNPERANYRLELLKEQFYLCAYCNTRLDEYEQENKMHHLKIEHWYPQTLCKTEPEYNTINGRDIAHQNMMLVCPGSNVNPNFLHCDSSRKSKVLLTIKPQDPAYKFQDVFTYEGAKLCTKNDLVDADINTELNLNHDMLINRRNIVLSQFRKSLPKKHLINKAALINQYSSPDKKSRKKAFCTLILYYIEHNL